MNMLFKEKATYQDCKPPHRQLHVTMEELWKMHESKIKKQTCLRGRSLIVTDCLLRFPRIPPR